MTEEPFLWLVPFAAIAFGSAVKLAFYLQRSTGRHDGAGRHRRLGDRRPHPGFGGAMLRRV